MIHAFSFPAARRRVVALMANDAFPGAVLVIALLATLLGFVRMSGPANAATITVALPSAHPATLLEETTGAAAFDMRAVGDQARVINAALPFSDTFEELATPFVIGGSETDKRLALTCLSQAVYYEAGSELVQGQRAVAQVVLNRVRHPAFPKSVCGVVYQGAGTGTCQFSFICNGALNRAPTPNVWREAEAVSLAALSGYVEPSVGEATHYHADYVTPRWAPLLAKVRAIGQHIFYRWPGQWGQASAFTGQYSGEPRDAMTIRLAQATYTLVNGHALGGAQLIARPHLTYHLKGLFNTLIASAPEPSQAEDKPPQPPITEESNASTGSISADAAIAGNS